MVPGAATSGARGLMPRIYLGTMTFAWEQASSPVTEEVAVAMCRQATRAGITTLDSAVGFLLRTALSHRPLHLRISRAWSHGIRTSAPSQPSPRSPS